MAQSEPDVLVCEVGLRDGLQLIDEVLSTDTKLVWFNREADAGVCEFEITSFVPVKYAPQFFDATAVVAAGRARGGVTVQAFVPNLKGAQLAVAAGVHGIHCGVSASRSHNRTNFRRTPEETLDEIASIVALRDSADPEQRFGVGVGVATAFGCTMEGAVDEAVVRDLAIQLAELDVDEITLADTVGYGNPAAVRRLFAAVASDVGDLPLRAHFHDTRGLGLANVHAALDAGVRRFDASLGGTGGCPHAPGATGNIVTEDLVFMLEAMGLRTGIDVAALIEVREKLAGFLPADELTGSLVRAGMPANFLPVQVAS